MLLYPICLSTNLMCPYVTGHFFVQPHSRIWQYYPWSNAVPDGRPMRYRSYRSIFPLLFFDFPRLLKYYLYSIHSLFVWRECLAHQVPIVLTVLSFRFSGLCLMVVNATIHFHGQASPVGVWSFLRLPLTRRAVKKKTKKRDSPFGKKSGNGPLLFPNKRKLIFLKTAIGKCDVV